MTGPGELFAALASPTGLVLVERSGRTATYRLADEQVAHVFLDAYRHSREGRNA